MDGLILSTFGTVGMIISIVYLTISFLKANNRANKYENKLYQTKVDRLRIREENTYNTWKYSENDIAWNQYKIAERDRDSYLKREGE